MSRGGRVGDGEFFGFQRFNNKNKSLTAGLEGQRVRAIARELVRDAIRLSKLIHIPPTRIPVVLSISSSSGDRYAISVFSPAQAWLQAAINLAKLEGPRKVGDT